MARRRMHSDESILDATRELLVRGGPEAATASAISATSGAPVGSLYHRFGSRTRLFAQVWLRTVTRFQAGLVAAADAADSGIDRALAAADWTVEFAARHPEDARLLLRGNREELLSEADLPARTRDELAELNTPVRELLHRLAVDLFGGVTPRRLELLTIAVVDLPRTIVRRHLRAGTSPEEHRPLVAGTVRALLADSTGR